MLNTNDVAPVGEGVDKANQDAGGVSAGRAVDLLAMSLHHPRFECVTAVNQRPANRPFHDFDVKLAKSGCLVGGHTRTENGNGRFLNDILSQRTGKSRPAIGASLLHRAIRQLSANQRFH